MTILRPNKNKFQFNILFAAIVGLVLFGAIFSIFANSRSVQLTHELRQERKVIEILQSENAELKNQLYAMIDFKDYEKIGAKLGLIKDRKPEYLTLER